MSKQQKIILDVLKSTYSHPTAEWIYEEARRIKPDISLGTVYRNLNKLVQSGDIMQVQGVFEKDRYDATVSNHPHFICKQCGEVVDVPSDEMIDSAVLNGELKGCLVEKYSLVYYGLCPKCNKEFI